MSADELVFPHHFSAARQGSDTIRVDGWNEDGSGEGPALVLTHATALDLIAAVAVALNTSH